MSWYDWIIRSSKFMKYSGYPYYKQRDLFLNLVINKTIN